MSDSIQFNASVWSVKFDREAECTLVLKIPSMNKQQAKALADLTEAPLLVAIARHDNAQT